MAKGYKPAMAPYNFISLPERVFEAYNRDEVLPAHNKIYKVEDGYYTGKIEYSIVTDSPMIVVDGEKKNGNVKTFFKNGDGKYAIPGNTIRGLIRNNVSILGMCNPAEDINDSQFLYRDWTSMDKRRKDQYKAAVLEEGDNGKTHLSDKVKAGYITFDGKNYIITPAKSANGKTFSYIREDKVRENIGKNENVHYMYEDAGLNHPVKKYVAYYTEAFYSLNEEAGISAVSINEKKAFKGMLMCSNYMGQKDFSNSPKGFEKAKKEAKKAHYVIFEADLDAGKIILGEDSKAIRSYQDDLVMKKKVKDPFFKLPEKGIKRPIFFLKRDGEYSIGTTPYLRILYENSVRAGIPKALNKDVTDYSKAMFGYKAMSGDKMKGYKTRVSFSDAVIDGTWTECEMVKTVLGEPKATWYAGYISQDNADVLTQYNDDFRIRGYKEYWLQNGTSKPNLGNGNENVLTKFIPLKNATFKGCISYTNLRKDELGLLLLSILLKEGSKQNLGLAKSLGYGKFHFADVKASYNDFENMFTSFGLDNESVVSINSGEFIEAYKQYVRDKGHIELSNQVFYKELMHMKTTEINSEYASFGIDKKSIPEQYGKLRVLPKALDYLRIVKDYCSDPDSYEDRSNKKKGNDPYYKNGNWGNGKPNNNGGCSNKSSNNGHNKPNSKTSGNKQFNNRDKQRTQEKDRAEDKYSDGSIGNRITIKGWNN